VLVALENTEIPKGACEVEMTGISKRFGTVLALNDVSVRFARGEVHALLGENGAGKSTLVKCLVGYYRPDAGQISVDAREREIRSPQDALALGIGMVYQHFTLVPSMTLAENLVMARRHVPRVLDWRRERAALEAFMHSVPFKLDLNRQASSLSAGEKQKAEILKQLYLGCRVMILDEPTSVLTPSEADEVLGMIRSMARQGQMTVLLITHKFREVMAFADRVTVLRRGAVAGGGWVGELTPGILGGMMIGTRTAARTGSHIAKRAASPGAAVLSIAGLCADNDAGLPAVKSVSIDVRAGEIVGVAGVSGNGQRELVEGLIGQRRLSGGSIKVNGKNYGATRGEIAKHRVFSLPEEPLRNACIAAMSVEDNMALRNYDRSPLALGPWLRRKEIRRQANAWIGDYKVKTAGPAAAMRTLSGGNVQRAVLARELPESVSVLIVANPVFGLDFSAVAEIHGRIVAARNAGAAVLMVSEDLDELLELSDRLLVMFGGQVIHETPTHNADVARVGRCMAGHAPA
jgi:general nucleoside transport system ATP-binding protein